MSSLSGLLFWLRSASRALATSSVAPRSASCSAGSASISSAKLPSPPYFPNVTEKLDRAHGRRRSHRRRDCRVEHCLSSGRRRLQECARARARNLAGQGIDRQEHGRSTRPVFYSRQHSDVVVFDPVLRELRGTAWFSVRLPSPRVFILRHQRKADRLPARELRKAGCHGIEECATARGRRDSRHVPANARRRHCGRKLLLDRWFCRSLQRHDWFHDLGQRPWRHRSEERRVGKECRSRWSPYPYNKKIHW